MFVEVHIIQNFSPACLNRDDTNTPKDCEFGGHRRARISSQSLKRAMRHDPVFSQTTQVEVGQRTRYMLRLLRPRLMAEGHAEDAVNTVTAALAEAYVGKAPDDKGRTNVLLYLSPQEVNAMVTALHSNWEKVLEEVKRAEAAKASAPDKKKKPEPMVTLDAIVKDLVKRSEGKTSAPDIALFGRMLAERPDQNLDAACQVAHAISTHAVTMELDYYTAVDDLTGNDESGAGMVGNTGFNSACFYRYTRLDWEQLLKNLDGDTAAAQRTVEGFLRAAVVSVPSARQNSFAAHNPPSFVFGVVRSSGQGWSLANAFESPVRAARESGFVVPSIRKLEAYWGQLGKVYGEKSVQAKAVLNLESDVALQQLSDAQVENLDAWVETLTSTLGGKS